MTKDTKHNNEESVQVKMLNKFQRERERGIENDKRWPGGGQDGRGLEQAALSRFWSGTSSTRLTPRSCRESKFMSRSQRRPGWHS